MGRTLRSIGVVVLAGAAWLLVAGEAGWISIESSGRWFRPSAQAGVVCLGLGLLELLLEPVSRFLRRGRCVRCGARIERGQTYCMDHLRTTLNEYQDRTHERGRTR